MPRTTLEIETELLVLDAQRGDAAALERLVRVWDAPLRRYAARVTGRPDAAPDIAQETWLGVVRGLRRLDDPSRFRAWAFRIAHHRCADWLDAQRRQRRTDARAPASPSGYHPAPDEDGEIALLRREIDAMPADSRAVLALHYLEGFALAEIAEALSIPTGTVKSRLHHARARLRERLERALTTGDQR